MNQLSTFANYKSSAPGSMECVYDPRDGAFRDLKSLLGMDKLMCQKRHWMEQMISLTLIAYAIALVLGEAFRSYLFPETSRKHKLYSGLFVLLKLKFSLAYPTHKHIRLRALQTFHSTTIALQTFF